VLALALATLTTLAAQDGPRVELRFENDTLPPPTAVISRARDHKRYAHGYSDDDGYTASLEAELTWTFDDAQLSAGVQAIMLTERLNDPGPGGYGARRNDLVTYSAQAHRAVQKLGTRVVFGLGGGVQRFGPQNLQYVQRGFHELTYDIASARSRLATPDRLAGGRLQAFYLRDDVETVPVLIGGLGVQRQTPLGVLLLEGDAVVPTGEGLLRYEARGGLRAVLWGALILDGALTFTGNHLRRADTRFLDYDSFGPGARVGVELVLWREVRVLGRAQFGGVRDEPTWTLGLAFGGGERSWIGARG
jgi:hypothetical protein